MTGSMVADYPHRIGGHCGSGALRDLLEWAGLDFGGTALDEGTVFGLAGDLSFGYLRGTSLGTPFYLVGRGSTLTERLCDRLGIGYERVSTDDPHEGWIRVRHQLDEGCPVLCWAEMAELPYLRVTMRMTRHDIVVIGYDDGAGTVTVVDNDRPEPQTIGQDDLARARSAQGFPMPTRHTSYRLAFPERLPELRAAAASACADAVHEMNHPASVSGGGLVSVDGGVDGVSAFVADLARWVDEYDERGLGRALFTLWAFIEKAGTGGGLFRGLQAGFLDSLAERVPDADVRAARDLYQRLAGTWSATAAAALGDAPAGDRLSAVRSVAAALPDLEREGVARLSAVAQRLAAR